MICSIVQNLELAYAKSPYFVNSASIFLSSEWTKIDLKFGMRIEDNPSEWCGQSHVTGFNLRTLVYMKLEMCANAQRDGRPAEYSWRPVFNAAKFA